jgi:hypothetical protein
MNKPRDLQFLLSTDEGVTIVEGHEEGESITDPNPPSGWYKGGYGEIPDI